MSSDPHRATQPGAQPDAQPDAQGPAPSGPWVDQDVQQLRPYVVADIRAVSRHEMQLDTVLTTATTTTDAASVAAARTGRADALLPEAAQAIGLCERGGCSVAEIAATIRQPVLVAMSLLQELLDAGALVIAPPAVPHGSAPGRPSPHLLQALLEGLKAS